MTQVYYRNRLSCFPLLYVQHNVRSCRLSFLCTFDSAAICDMVAPLILDSRDLTDFFLPCTSNLTFFSRLACIRSTRLYTSRGITITPIHARGTELAQDPYLQKNCVLAAGPGRLSLPYAFGMLYDGFPLDALHLGKARLDTHVDVTTSRHSCAKVE